LEPLLVIGLAGLVATVAIGVLMPIFDLTTYIR
jgi:type II secretory pathway component PulF